MVDCKHANRSFKESSAASRAAKIGMSLTGCERKHVSRKSTKPLRLSPSISPSFLSYQFSIFCCSFQPSTFFLNFNLFLSLSLLSLAIPLVFLPIPLVFLPIPLVFLPIPLVRSSWLQLEKLHMFEEASALAWELLDIKQYANTSFCNNAMVNQNCPLKSISCS